MFQRCVLGGVQSSEWWCCGRWNAEGVRLSHGHYQLNECFWNSVTQTSLHWQIAQESYFCYVINLSFQITIKRCLTS